jgi:hypothetical protein
MPSRLFLAALFFSFAAQIVLAQGKVMHVMVDPNPNDASQEVGSLLRGKIGSTLRYALTDVEKADLIISIVCVQLKSSGAVACTNPTNYYPDLDSSLHSDLNEAIVTGDKEWVAQNFFDYFVRDTSDDKLKELAEKLSRSTSKVWVEAYNLGVESGKAACAPKPKPVPKQ